MTPEEALKGIRSGQRVLVGSGASAPRRLVEGLAAIAHRLSDVEAVHLMTLGPAPYAKPGCEGRIRHNALFIGSNVRGAVQGGLADYTPCFLSEVPRLIRSGRLPIDAALISAAPARGGNLSLGVSVDIVKAAVEVAPLVICQVNRRMPWTLGGAVIPASDVDVMIEADDPLPELTARPATAEAAAIGRYVARLVRDGDAIQAGIGVIPDAALSALSGKKKLRVHSEMISDGMLELWNNGAIEGTVVTSFCLGSRTLYDAVHRNAAFSFMPSDYVNNPAVIASIPRFVSINSAIEVDLTGQVCADSMGRKLYSGVGGQVDFIRGSAWSEEGRSIIALPSTARDGVSRIVPTLTEGAGVVTTRADVDFIVTEWGIASLKGKTIRERATALIQAAHPAHRAALFEAAKRHGYLDHGQVMPLSAQAYRADLERVETFGGERLFFRPLKPTDERKLKDLFYSQSPETTLKRFGMPLKRLSERQFQELVAMDGRHAFAIGAFALEGRRERLIGIGRYILEPGSESAEAAFTVRDDWQGRGVGAALIETVARVARQAGLKRLSAQVLLENAPMLHLLRKAFPGRKEEGDSACRWLTLPL